MPHLCQHLIVKHLRRGIIGSGHRGKGRPELLRVGQGPAEVGWLLCLGRLKRLQARLLVDGDGGRAILAPTYVAHDSLGPRRLSPFPVRPGCKEKREGWGGRWGMYNNFEFPTPCEGVIMYTHPGGCAAQA